ncbi:hypothetical protein PROFUN_15290 [Planoprotostelium fungivorum]|uniref:B box-type domain-containing protein n=1 Tax=Planoprotostelium fungivorum TaxID=1890364 RepID=A0A2P6MMB2_9EUKA|nr:hypothetical protein PROFUN_15290 [Planoprotostelium fungivorum]
MKNLFKAYGSLSEPDTNTCPVHPTHEGQINCNKCGRNFCHECAGGSFTCSECNEMKAIWTLLLYIIIALLALGILAGLVILATR